MAIKEGEDFSIDNEFLKKYIRDSANDKKEDEGHFSEKDFEMKKLGPTEVFSRVGEGESYPDNKSFNKRSNDENVGEAPNKVEFNSNPVSEAKQEFIKHLENESLSIDTCRKVNQDWKRKWNYLIE